MSIDRREQASGDMNLGPYQSGLGVRRRSKSAENVSINVDDSFTRLREELMQYTNNMCENLSTKMDQRLEENKQCFMASQSSLDNKLGSISSLLENFMHTIQRTDNNLINSNASANSVNSASSNVNSQSQLNSSCSVPSVAQSNVVGNFIKPDTFDGSVSFDSYLRSFEIAAKHNAWTIEQKASFLATSLRGKAQNLLENLSNEDLFNFEKLKSLLTSIFTLSRLQLIRN